MTLPFCDSERTRSASRRSMYPASRRILRPRCIYRLVDRFSFLVNIKCFCEQLQLRMTITGEMVSGVVALNLGGRIDSIAAAALLTNLRDVFGSSVA